MTTRELLEVDGFAVASRVGASVVDAGLDLHLSRRDCWAPGFSSTARDGSAAERLRFDDLIKSLLRPELERVLGAQHVFMAGILDKSCDSPALDLHCDLTYTDERRYRSFTCWVPLVDTAARNGAIRVVPGSHLWSRGIRSAGPGSAPLPDDVRIDGERRAISLELIAGSMLIWDNALLHGSWSNCSETRRPAIAATFTSPSAEVRYHWAGHGDALRAFVIDDFFLGDDSPFQAAPTGYEPVEPWPLSPEVLWQVPR